MKAYAIEFLGTFFLALTVLLSGSPLALASILMAWVYIGGYISGAHYNPMISFVAWLQKIISAQELFWYIVAQCAGATAAYALSTLFIETVFIPAPTISFARALTIESLCVFVLALVVLTVMSAKQLRGNCIFGLATGLTIPALASISGQYTGALFNPSLAIGSALMSLFYGTPIVWENIFLYCLGGFIGGITASLTFTLLQKE